MRNPFDLVCILASEDSWCSRLYCTTCGCLNFRYAFADLAKGKSPEDKDWVVRYGRAKDQGWMRTHEFNWRDGFTDEQKEAVMSICADADIGFIKANSKSPEWPSYFGLMLHFMLSKSDTCKLAAAHWAEQLKELIPQYPEEDRATIYKIEDFLRQAESIRGRE